MFSIWIISGKTVLKSWDPDNFKTVLSFDFWPCFISNSSQLTASLDCLTWPTYLTDFLDWLLDWLTWLTYLTNWLNLTRFRRIHENLTKFHKLVCDWVTDSYPTMLEMLTHLKSIQLSFLLIWGKNTKHININNIWTMFIGYYTHICVVIRSFFSFLILMNHDI